MSNQYPVLVGLHIGNSLDFDGVEPDMLHINADNVSIMRNAMTGQIAAYTVFSGPGLPPNPGVGDPMIAIDLGARLVYTWDGLAWGQLADINWATADTIFTGNRTHLADDNHLSISQMWYLELVARSAGNNVTRFDAGDQNPFLGNYGGASMTIQDGATEVYGFVNTSEELSSGTYLTAMGLRCDNTGDIARVAAELDNFGAAPTLISTVNAPSVGTAVNEMSAGGMTQSTSHISGASTAVEHVSAFGSTVIESTVSDGSTHIFTQKPDALESTAYPNTRDDSFMDSPTNFLYTTPAGALRSAPTSAISSPLRPGDIGAPRVLRHLAPTGVATDKDGNAMNYEGTITVQPGEMAPYLFDPSFAPQIELLRWRPRRGATTGVGMRYKGAGWVHPVHFVGASTPLHSNGTRSGEHSGTGTDRPTEWDISSFTQWQKLELDVGQVFAPWFYSVVLTDWNGGKVTSLAHVGSGGPNNGNASRGVQSRAPRGAFAFRISVIDPTTGFRVSGPPSITVHAGPKRWPYINTPWAGNPQPYLVNPAVSANYEVLTVSVGDERHR